MSGIGLRLIAAFLIAAMSLAVHEAAKFMLVGQIMFWCSCLALGPICLYMALRTERPGLHLMRGLLGAFAMGMSFLSLAKLPVATAQALGFLPRCLSPRWPLGCCVNVSRRCFWRRLALGFLA